MSKQQGKFFVGFDQNRQNSRGTGRTGRPQDSDIFASLRDPGYTNMHSPGSGGGRPPRNGSPRGGRIGTPTRVSRGVNGTPQRAAAASPYGNQYNEFQNNPTNDNPYEGGSAAAAPPPPSMMPPQQYQPDSPGSYLDRPGTKDARVRNLGDGSNPSWCAIFLSILPSFISLLQNVFNLFLDFVPKLLSLNCFSCPPALAERLV